MKIFNLSFLRIPICFLLKIFGEKRAAEQLSNSKKLSYQEALKICAQKEQLKDKFLKYWHEIGVDV
jgi:hypothetical protein